MRNNAAERELRAIAVGRRNWTFAGSDEGGGSAARVSGPRSRRVAVSKRRNASMTFVIAWPRGAAHPRHRPGRCDGWQILLLREMVGVAGFVVWTVSH